MQLLLLCWAQVSVLFRALAQAVEPAAREFCACKGVLDTTKPWRIAESFTLKLLKGAHGFSGCSVFPVAKPFGILCLLFSCRSCLTRLRGQSGSSCTILSKSEYLSCQFGLQLLELPLSLSCVHWKQNCDLCTSAEA